MIPANELEAMRAVAESALDTPITITRPASATAGTVYGSASGGGSETQVATCNALFAKPTGPTLAVLVGQVGTLLVWMMQYPVSVPIKQGDYVTVNATGEKLKVHSVTEVHSYSLLNSATVAAIR